MNMPTIIFLCLLAVTIQLAFTRKLGFSWWTSAMVGVLCGAVIPAATALAVGLLIRGLV